MEERPYRPGQHGRRPTRLSDYKVRLLEKQRLRAQYGLREAQFRAVVDRAQRRPEPTGQALLTMLETRLDAIVLRAGFARTIWQARQHVSHGHIRVDGAKVDRPSYQVRPGQVVEVAEKAKQMVPFQIAAAGEHAERIPPYLEVDRSQLRARLIRLPKRSEIPVLCNETLVVEFYAR